MEVQSLKTLIDFLCMHIATIHVYQYIMLADCVYECKNCSYMLNKIYTYSRDIAALNAYADAACTIHPTL